MMAFFHVSDDSAPLCPPPHRQKKKILVAEKRKAGIGSPVDVLKVSPAQVSAWGRGGMAHSRTGGRGPFQCFLPFSCRESDCSGE
jgi:hypothetical protein